MNHKTDEKVAEIAARLRKIHELKNLTREQFCERLGENVEYWGKSERGEQTISLGKLLQVCEVYHIRIEEIITLDFQERSSPSDIADQRNGNSTERDANPFLRSRPA